MCLDAHEASFDDDREAFSTWVAERAQEVRLDDHVPAPEHAGVSLAVMLAAVISALCVVGIAWAALGAEAIEPNDQLLRFEVIENNSTHPFAVVMGDGRVLIDWPETVKAAAMQEREAATARLMLAIRDGTWRPLDR